MSHVAICVAIAAISSSALRFCTYVSSVSFVGLICRRSLLVVSFKFVSLAIAFRRKFSLFTLFYKSRFHRILSMCVCPQSLL